MAEELVPKPPPQRGRPSSFNQERAERLLLAVRGGNYLETACSYAGIGYTTLRRWIAKADDPDSPPEYLEFKEALEKARADAEVGALAKIQKAASEGAWQASAWYLERSRPEKWSRRDTSRVELVGEGGGPIKLVAGMELTADSMNALAQRLASRDAADKQDIIDAEIIDEYTLELEAGGPEAISDSEIAEVTEAWSGEDE